jgi:hypothetical protein
VQTVLSSRYPLLLLWGEELTQLYDDAYAQLIGDEHPSALGGDVRDTLAEGWEVLGDDVGRTVGVLTVSSEVTTQAVAERRLSILRDLSLRSGAVPASSSASRVAGASARRRWTAAAGPRSWPQPGRSAWCRPTTGRRCRSSGTSPDPAARDLHPRRDGDPRRGRRRPTCAWAGTGR